MSDRKLMLEDPAAYYAKVGAEIERERIIEIIEKRRDYDCRCKCKCHAVPAPCIACQADNGLIEIIRGEK